MGHSREILQTTDKSVQESKKIGADDRLKSISSCST